MKQLRAFLKSTLVGGLLLILPLAIFIFVLLFPFYWMGITSFKTNEELHAYRGLQALWLYEPTLENIRFLLWETDYPRWLWNTMLITVTSTFLSIFCAVCAAYAIERLPDRGLTTRIIVIIPLPH